MCCRSPSCAYTTLGVREDKPCSRCDVAAKQGAVVRRMLGGYANRRTRVGVGRGSRAMEVLQQQSRQQTAALAAGGEKWTRAGDGGAKERSTRHRKDMSGE